MEVIFGVRNLFSSPKTKHLDDNSTPKIQEFIDCHIVLMVFVKEKNSADIFKTSTKTLIEMVVPLDESLHLIR